MLISKDTKCLGVSWSPSKDILHYNSYNTLMAKKKPKLLETTPLDDQNATETIDFVPQPEAGGLVLSKK